MPGQPTVDQGRITFEVHSRGALPHVFQVTGAGIDTHIALLPGGLIGRSVGAAAKHRS